jgi:hypothetical protein
MTTEAISFPQGAAADAQPRVAATRRAKSSTGTSQGVAGMAWFAGWLFTVGFAKLVWWKAILGVVVWPYFLGDAVH